MWLNIWGKVKISATFSKELFMDTIKNEKRLTVC